MPTAAPWVSDAVTAADTAEDRGLSPNSPWAAAHVIATVAVLYLTVGIIGMSLAIPPAQATPLFPAAGLAVAAVLRHGTAAVAGVWLGQALMQILRHALAGGLPTSSLLACWAMLSLGAALQAAVAAAFVRHRYPPAQPGAPGTRRLFGLLFLSGMIACTVSASIGVATLTAAGFVGPDESVKAWWEWYSGDTLGVFIFAPIIVMLVERRNLRWSDDVLQVLGRMGLVTVLILVVFVIVRRWEARGGDAAVREAALTVANDIAVRVIERQADPARGASTLDPGAMVGDLLAERPLPVGMHLRVWRPRADGAAEVLFESRPTSSVSGFRVTTAVPVPGGPWTLEAAAGPGIAGRGYDLSWVIALLSIVLTGILADRDLAAQAARLHATETLVEKERIRRDLVIARDIQRGLLPKNDTCLAGFDIAGWNQAADETGGDYYDFVPLGGDTMAVAIADVTGHGIGAALVVAEVRALFRAEVMRASDLDTVVARVHDLLASDLPEERLVTACFAIVSASRGSLRFLSAGHGPVLFRSASGTVRLLGPQGLPIGFFPQPRYAPAVELPMAEGDVFMVLTDGFFEWTDRFGRQFGIERIETVLAEHGHLPAAELIGKIRESVVAFADGTPQTDDLTAIVVKRNAAAGRGP